MSRASVISIRSLALVLGITVLSSCSPDNAGIRRLPLEPDVSPGTLTVSPSAALLPYLGATSRLTASVLPDGSAAGLSYQWVSLNTGVVTVAADGTITAIAEGEASVMVRVMNLVDTATVTVKRLPATVTLDPDTALFTELGASLTVTGAVADGGGVSLPASDILWVSSDTSVVTVSTSGVITSVGQGNATVRATAGTVVASVSVRVAVGPADIAVTPAQIQFVSIGDTQQLSTVVTNAAGAEMDSIGITYESDDTTVAAVSAEGLVTAIATGSASILVSGDTVHATVEVEVVPVAATVVITPEGVKAVAGATVSYSATAADANGFDIGNPVLAWSSTDTTVATVASDGVATAVAAGVAGIVALSGEAADTVELEVVEPVTDSIAVDVDSLNLVIDQTASLTAVLFDAEGDELVGAVPVWSSDDDAVATVNTAGTVTGVGVGTTWIRAQADDGADSTYVEVISGVSEFDIEVRYVGTEPDAATQAAFASAEARWEELLLGDLQDGLVNLAASACGIDHEAVNETVDDLLIYAEVTAIDGAGGVLGQAGPCLVRLSDGLAILGTMQFDEDDMATLATDGLLDVTIMHEMGHVLGFGVGDPWTDVLVGKESADPYWPGAEAVTRYQASGGAEVNAVPVANTGGEGTRDAHWREAHMGRELMTGFINTGANPLSAISIGAMQDMGYIVNISEADAYTVSASLRAGPSRFFELNDAVLMPIMVLDTSGRIRVIGRR